MVYDLLFRAASETMFTIAADPRHLDARIGITAVLHTWGSALTFHPIGWRRYAGIADLEPAHVIRRRVIR